MFRPSDGNQIPRPFLVGELDGLADGNRLDGDILPLGVSLTKYPHRSEHETVFSKVEVYPLFRQTLYD